MLKKLFSINLFGSLVITAVISTPVFLILSRTGSGFAQALFAGRAAAVYFLLAFLLYAFLYAISHLPRGKGHRRLVVFTRVYIRFHIALAITGTLLIIIHILYMTTLPVTAVSIAGIAAAVALLPLLITGYFRKQKSSGRRRRFHRYAAFVFVGLVIIHLIL